MDEIKIHSKTNIEKLSQLLLHYLQRIKKRSFCAILSLFLVLLLAYNTLIIFSLRFPLPAKTPPVITSFLPENVAGKPRKLVSLSSSAKKSYNLMYAVKEESPVAEKKTLLKLLRKEQTLAVSYKRRKLKTLGKFMGQQQVQMKKFSTRVKEFFSPNLTNSCKFRFFMTWVSSIESFGERELFCIESLFKWHPNGCLIIASHSLDSRIGNEILRPFLDKGFQVTAISPDFNYLLKNTVAEAWFDRLIRGKVDTGEVSLGQNLSNLLRLGLLYKFGGIYLDTDVIVLKSFSKLKNTIGAQTINFETKNWSRLNNAVMVFDKGHPLLYKFIEEFALTFDGNKWGHNGPYLVSRVVSRVHKRPGYNITVLPPTAFYPVDWSRIGSLFRGPRNESHSKWLVAKLVQIRGESFAVHLWNKQSRKFTVEEGSIIKHIMADCCIFCNSVNTEQWQ